jgi:formylglycine-generating enzyme required for sulfatase activity
MIQEALPARVIRGGGWDVPAGLCRSAYRFWFESVSRLNFLGFRLVLGYS